MSGKIIVIENDVDQRMKISAAFERAGDGSLRVEFRSCAEAVAIPYDYHNYSLVVMDVGPDPQAAVIAARFIQSIKPDMAFVLLAPSDDFETPAELSEMGAGPVIVSDKRGIATLPETVGGLVVSLRERERERVVQDDLRKRNKELREITDALARQSVRLLQLRNELSAETKKLETVVNGMADGMAFFGVDGGLGVINPVARKLLPNGVEVNGLTFDGFMRFLNADAARDAKRGGEYDTFEAELGKKVFRVRVAGVADAEGTEAGSLILLTDITKEKEYELLKDDFSSMISHELRTPLTSIRAAVDNLIRGNLGSVNDEQRNFLELIARNVDRQQGLIDDLLDLAKAETGQMILRPEPVDFHQLARQAVEQFSLAFKDKNITVATRFDKALPPIEADPNLITQVLTNLLSNALKFTGVGGRVSVTVEMARTDGAPAACLTVADTGIGVEPDQRERIFEKYTQADSSTRRRYPGTGLGLAICREIMRAHGGSIRVDSEPGEGSRFTICLPAPTDGRRS